MQINITKVGKGDEPHRFNPDDQSQLRKIVEMLSEYVNQGFLIYGKNKDGEKVNIPIRGDIEEKIKQLTEFTISEEYTCKTAIQGVYGG